MPQNLQDQILQRIVRLSADGNSQREVVRMLGVTKRLADHIRGSVEVRWKSPRHGKTVNFTEWSEQNASSQLLACECRWSADLGGGCQFKPFGDGFWLPDIGRGVQPDVLGSLWSTGDAAVSWGGGTECGTGDTVSSVMSPGCPYTRVTVGSGCDVGKGRGWLMPASSLMMEIVARQSWYGCNPPWGRSELVVVNGAMNLHRYIQILRNQMLPWTIGVFGRNFVYIQDNALPHTARDSSAFLDQQDVKLMDWPDWSLDMNPIEHVWDQMSVWIRDMDDPPSTVAELNNAVHQAWAAVRPGRVRTLVESMPRRVRAVLATRGGHTRY